MSRRDLLVKGTVGIAAVTALTAATADVAHAHTRTTITGVGDGTYGAAVGPTAFDPDALMQALNGTSPALVGTTSASAPSPTTQSAVLGLANTSRGVQGLSNSNYGVYGQSSSSTAVRGEIPITSASNSTAVIGLNNSTFAGPSSGAGGFGIYGASSRGHGLVGATGIAGGAAVVGATNGVAGAWAAVFYGPTFIQGDFVATGAKSAAVRHPDGSHRLLYCVESPESWFEDFGKGELECGRADVTIDASFAAVADLDDYHVFITAYDHDHLLRVTNRTRTGFTVQADIAFATLKHQQERDLSGTFSWRIVAKRKDIRGERFARVPVPSKLELPSLEHPQSRPEGR